MPNRPGYGIFGLPRDGDGVGPRPASQILAVKAGQQLFSPASTVYEWCHGVWELVWTAATNPPTGVTAVYSASGTKVTVTWVEPAVNAAASYTVFRPDGTVVAANIPLGTTSTVDDLPNFAAGTYKVQAINAAGNSAQVAAAPVTINLQAATATATLVGNTSATVAWTAAAQGNPDFWQIFDASSGAALSGLIAGTVHSWPISVAPATTRQFVVNPILSGALGAGRTTNAVNSAPDPPINAAITPLINELRLTFNYPGGNIARYEIQVMDSLVQSSFVNLDLNNVSGLSDWITETSAGYMRVRAISSAGVAGAYAQVGPRASLVPAPQVLLYNVHPTQPQWNNFSVNITYGNYQPQFCAEYYWANFPGNGWQTGGFVSGGPSCTPGNNSSAAWTWVIPKLQNSPTYARVKAVRNGVESPWNQVGPV